MTKKTKIKIAAISIVGLVIMLASTILILQFNTISYAFKFNTPSRIVVYYNDEAGNQVYEPGSDEYRFIYSAICEAYRQPILTAMFNGELNKDVKINESYPTAVDFNGIKVNFVYDTPQVVKNKKSVLNGGNTYWYQNLIFDIDQYSGFKYNTVAIIPPPTADNYEGPNIYSLYYLAYSNFGSLYNSLVKYF